MGGGLTGKKIVTPFYIFFFCWTALPSLHIFSTDSPSPIMNFFADTPCPLTYFLGMSRIKVKYTCIIEIFLVAYHLVTDLFMCKEKELLWFFLT